MIKTKLLFWTITPLVLTSCVAAPVIINQLNIDKKNERKIKKESYIDRTKLILDDILKTNVQNDLLDVNLIIKEKFQKILRIIFQIDEYTLWNEYKYKMNAKPLIDFDNKIVKTSIKSSIEFNWTDKMSGYFGDFIKKKPKKLILNTPEIKLTTDIKLKDRLPYADFFTYEFDEYNLLNQYLTRYNFSRTYVFYSVLTYTTYYFNYEMPKQTNYIIKNNIDKIWKKFIRYQELDQSENVDNLNSVKNKKFLKFNEHFSTLYELNKIAKIYNELNDKKDKTINEKLFINQLENYQFYSFENVEKKYDFLKRTGSLMPLKGDENFSLRVIKLLKTINENKKDDMLVNNYTSFQIIYYILINFFASHNIKISTSFNNQNMDIYLWQRKNFQNVFEQLPKDLQENRNIQILKVNEISQEKTIENNVVFHDTKWRIDQEFKFKYRWNALNQKPYIKNIKTDGILLNINKYISEIIFDNTLINPKWLLDVVNKAIFNTDVFSSIELLNNENWINYSNDLDIKKFNNFFNLNCDKNNFNFIPDDGVGNFYAIAKISNIVFSDGTSGDYYPNFKEKILEKLNLKYNNIYEIKQKNNDVFFVIKLQTNKIHII